jgi:hypothetical protein
MATQSTENIQLKGAEDWEDWSTEFKTRAIAANIWRLITPRPGQRNTDPLREEPIAPQLSDYEKKPATARENARENRAQTAQSSGTMQEQPSQPSQPPPEEDESWPKELSVLPSLIRTKPSSPKKTRKERRRANESLQQENRQRNALPANSKDTYLRIAYIYSQKRPRGHSRAGKVDKKKSTKG